MERNDHYHAPFRERVKNYLIFLGVLSIILVLVSIKNDFLLAPPYAVSAYLIVFRRDTHYSNSINVVATYSLVIVSSDVTHYFIGPNVLGMLLNLLLVSAFITFTELSHPPAIALLIFSYITNNSLNFTISSFLSLVVLAASALLVERFYRSI